MDRCVELAEWHLANTHLAGKVSFDPAITRDNLLRALMNRGVRFFVGEYEGVVTSFLIARVDHWLVNNNPFLSEITLVTGPEPTRAAGLSLLRAMHAELEDNDVEQMVVTFYSGIKEDKMVALLESMGYTHAGVVMKRGC